MLVLYIITIFTLEIMKKLMFMALAVLALASCSENTATQDEVTDNTKVEPATEVYIQGNMMSAAATRAAVATTDNAYFFIRVDNRIPGIGNFSSKEYYPQTIDGLSVFADGNKGAVDLTYPGWDHNSDYPMYVYDTKGVATQKAISSMPTLEDLVKADESTNNATLKSVDLSNLHVLWYIVKKQNVDNKWHIDGVLTTKDVTDVKDVPGVSDDIKKENKDLDDKRDEKTVEATGDGNVEVDIHQQAHKDWSEIKTSIHVRDEVAKKVIVEIPIPKENVAEKDDFAVRTWDFNIESKVFINGSEYQFSKTNPVNVTIEHQTDKVVITVDCTNAAEYIKALRKEYGDGVTVEVHTYGKNLSNVEVWQKVKLSTIRVEPAAYNRLKYKGATSAYFSE